MFEIVELLNRINSQLMGALAADVRDEGLKRMEMIILWKVYHKGICRTTDVAKDAGIPPSTFTGIVDRLESKSLVERIYDSSDRRSVLLKGTPELQGYMERIKSKCDSRLTEVFRNLPENEFEHILGALKSLLNYLQREQGSMKEAVCGETGEGRKLETAGREEPFNQK